MFVAEGLCKNRSDGYIHTFCIYSRINRQFLAQF